MFAGVQFLEFFKVIHNGLNDRGVAPRQGRNRNGRSRIRVYLFRQHAGRQRARHCPPQIIYHAFKVFGRFGDCHVILRHPHSAYNPRVAGNGVVAADALIGIALVSGNTPYFRFHPQGVFDGLHGVLHLYVVRVINAEGKHAVEAGVDCRVAVESPILFRVDHPQKPFMLFTVEILVDGRLYLRCGLPVCFGFFDVIKYVGYVCGRNQSAVNGGGCKR